MRSIGAALVVVAVATVQTSAPAQTQKLASEGSGVTAYSFSQIDQTGLALTGPKTLVVKRINPLRYADARLVGNTSTDDKSGAGAVAAALANAFNFGNTASGTATGAEKNLAALIDVAESPTSDKCSDAALDPTTAAPAAFAACYGQILGLVVLAEAQAAADGRKIAATIVALDAKLRNSGDDRTDYAAARAIVRTADQAITARGDIGEAWPKLWAVQLSGHILAKKVVLSGDPVKNKDALAALKLVSDELAPLLDGGQRRQKFDDVVKAQNDWEARMGAVSSDDTLGSFETPALTVSCLNQLFDQHTTVAWKATDLVDTSKTAPVSINVVTVNCYSRVAVTQGAVLAPRGTTQYSLGPAFGSTSTTTQQIYATSSGATDASASPAIIHYRVTPDSESVALHVSWAPFSVQKQFVGASLSFSRFLFLSAGVMRDEVATLSNGYAAGQMVPNGTTLPTSKAYRGRFAYAISVNVPAAATAKQTKPAKGTQGGENTPDTGAKPGTPPTTTGATPDKPPQKP